MIAMTPEKMGRRMKKLDTSAYPAAGVFAVQRGNGGIRLGVIRHLDKSKAARAAGIAVGYHGGAFDRAVRLEELTQFILGKAEREVANEDFFHVIFL